MGSGYVIELQIQNFITFLVIRYGTLCHYALPPNGIAKAIRLGIRMVLEKIVGVRTMTIVRSQAFSRAGRPQQQI